MPIDAGTVTAQVRVDRASLRADLLDANLQIDGFSKKAGSQVQALAKTWISAFGGIGLAIGGVTLAITGLKKSIQVFADFEQSLANVRAVAGASAEEFARLEQAASDAGATTRFTASEAADAMYFLASAGYDATQSIEALDGVLLLAGATGADLASTAQTMTAAISQFGLKASDAAKVSNVFAAAIGNSRATIGKLAASMRQVGPIAGALGISLEETTAALEALYNAGFQGEQAGTALRNIFADLGNESSTVAKNLYDLGLTFDQFNPSVVGFTGAIEALEGAGITAADALAIFGKEAGPQLATLLATGSEGLRELEAEITNTQAASEQYAIQNDTLSGSIDRFKSISQALGIAIGKELAPFLRNVLDIGIKLLEWLTDATPAIADFIERLVFPVTGTAAFFAELARGRSIASQYASDLDRISESLSIVNDTIEATKAVKVQREELDGLVEEYEILTSKTTLNADEQERLNKVIELLAQKVPDAASAFDEFGNAVEINTGIARDASKDLLELERSNKEAALATLSAEKGIAEERAKALEFTRESSRKQFEETQNRLQKISGQVANLRAIENKYFSEREAAGENELALQEARNRAAKDLLDAKLISEEQYQRVLNNQIGIVQLLNTEALPLKETYADLTKQVDEQFQSWQEVEQQYQRSNELLLEIKKTELEIEGIDNTLNVIAEQNNDIKEEGVKKTDELRESEKKALDDAIKDSGRFIAKLTERAEIEAEYHKKRLEQTDQRIALLDIEYEEAIKRAESLGADTTDIDMYYSEERRRILEEEKDEQLSLEERNYLDFSQKIQDKTNNFKDKYSSMSSIALDFFGALSALYQADTQARIQSLNEQTDALLSDLERRKQAELETAGLLEETEIQRLQRELAEAIATGDAANIAEAEDKLRRAEIEQRYFDEETRIKEDAKKKEADLQYRGETAAWQFKLLSAIAAAPIAIINALNTGFGAGFPAGLVLGPTLAALATASTGVQIAAIRAAKPKKPKLATGALVLPRNRQGTDVTVAENGFPEVLFNSGPEGQPFLRQFASVVADEILRRGFPIRNVFNLDGRKIAENSATYYKNNQVRLQV